MSSYEELCKLRGYNVWGSNGYLNKIDSPFKKSWDEDVLREELKESLSIDDPIECDYYNLIRRTEEIDMIRTFKCKFYYYIPKDHQQNYLTDFYIVFEYSKLTLETYEKLSILDTKITIRIGGQTLESIELDANLLLCLLADKKYIDSGGSLAVPIFFFDQFNSGMFPAWNTVQQKLMITLDTNDAHFGDNFRVKLRYDWFDGECYREDSDSITFMPYIQNSPLLSDCASRVDLYGLNLTYKMILIRFVPKNYKTDINFDYGDQPEIDSVSVSVRDKEPYYLTNISCFEFMGIKIYSIGTSPEFEDYDSMRNSLQKILKTGKCSDMGLVIPNNSSLHIDFNNTYEMFNVKTGFITSNSLGFYKGLVGVRLLMQNA